MQQPTLVEPILTGRKEELEELHRNLDLAMLGNGTTVFISGKAGSGKTRLITEFLNTIKTSEITTLSGWCLRNDALPYFPFIEAFNSNILSKEGGDFFSQHLSKRAWSSNSDQSEKLEITNNPSPQVWKDQVFSFVTRELLFMSSVKSLILVLEDMHWADSGSLALLHYISRALVNEKVLILVTFRNEELGRDVDGRTHPFDETIHLMGREGLYKEIKLTNLNQDSVKEIAESMLGGTIDLNFVNKLMQESQGNPLFVVEFLRMLYEQGQLFQDESQWRLSVDNLGLPSKVRDVILRRIGGLKPHQKRVLDVASVIGDKFNPKLIGKVLSKDHLKILEILDNILNSTSLVLVEENFYSFDHAKSREVLYNQLSIPLRQGYHEKIGEQIENEFQNGKEISFSDLAYHYAQAGNKKKSIKYALLAGQDALARFSNVEAIKHFKHILKSVAVPDELVDERKIALEGLGDAYVANCMYAEAIKIFDQLGQSETGLLRLRALRKAMEAAFVKGDKPDLLLEYAKKAESLFSYSRLEMGRIILNRGRAFAWAGQGSVEQDVADYKAALEIFEEENSIADVAEALWRNGEACFTSEDFYKKLGLLLRSRFIFKEIGDVRKEIAVSRSIGNTFLFLGLFDEAKKELEKVSKLGKNFGVFNELARSQGILGLIDEYEGNFVEALSKVSTALECIKKTDVDYVQAFDISALTRIYSKLGDLNQADHYFEKLTTLVPKTLSAELVKLNFALSKGVYFTAKQRFNESNQIFEALVPSIDGSLFITDYLWALEKQGNFKKARIYRSKLQNFFDSVERKFEHGKMQLSVLVPRTVNVGEIFEIRIDLVNVATTHGKLIKVEGLDAHNSKVISFPSFCSIQKTSLIMNNKLIEPFQVESIKIKMKFLQAGIYTLDLLLHYTNNSNKLLMDRANPIAITVRCDSNEKKAKSIINLKAKLEFKSEAAEKAFKFLINAFVEDYFQRKLPKEKCGWRTLMDIVKQTKVSKYSMYGSSNHRGSATTELENMGVVDARFFSGERGRGGKILKLRFSYENINIKPYTDKNF